MAAKQLMLPANRAFNSNGLAVPGAVAKLYTTGTLTPRIFYSDSGLSVSLGSSITADATGRFDPAYQDETIPFRLIVEDSLGTQLDDIDPYYFGSTYGSVIATANTNAATRALMAALTGVAGATVTLSEAGREGVFVFSSANLSTQVTNDPQQGIYVPPTAAPTGASGAWVRKHDGPINARWFGASTSSADNKAAIQAALTYINSLGGGALFIPAGTYAVLSSMLVSPNTTIIGDGKKGTILSSTHAGSGTLRAGVQSGSMFYCEAPLNSSTAVNVRIQDIQIKNNHASNIGAGFYDQGGTFVSLFNVNIEGFKYGVVMDQTELADIDLCTIQSQLTASVWLVNGVDLDATSSADFTNRISVTRCQINQSATAYGILDDGGVTHSYVDNNYNGCLNHMRLAGVAGLKISGGEFEAAAQANLRFEATRLSGGGVGSCNPVYIGDGAMIVPSAGQNCIIAISMGGVVFNSVYFGNAAAVKYNGTTNTTSIYAFNAFNAGGGATFDGRATNHFEAGTDGTSFATRTNLPVVMSGTTALDASRNATLAGATIDTGGSVIYNDSGGATFQGIVQRIVDSPYRYHSVVSKGGAGWQGAYRVQLNYNAGTLFDAFKITANTDGTTADATLTGPMNVTGVYKVDAVQVVGNQGAAVADATDAASAITQLNALLARCRAHGLIAT